MPELPEVERATNLVKDVAVGKRIESVETVEDDIVFSGVTHKEFAKEITGRRVVDAGRYGKCFYLELDGQGRMPVLHFGMTGMLQVKGQLATYYRETPKAANTDWPPRFVKFILHLVDDATGKVAQLAFLDARRLGRIRLRASPLTEPPISELGFDPILSMPTLDDFSTSVLKRSCPIKALLLDQTFSAGVGNWVADEILYNAQIHPEQRCNTLSPEQLTALHHQTSDVCRIAVSVNADDSKFPDHWLFKHRWGKGKKKEHILTLPSGEPATIKWITVGGRTSAYVEELQFPPEPVLGSTPKKRAAKGKSKVVDEEDSDTDPVPSTPKKHATKKRTPKGKRKVVDEGDSDLTPLTDSSGPDFDSTPGSRKRAKQKSESPSTPRRRTRTTGQSRVNGKGVGTSKYFDETET
ncbi:putative formamidopyrimidine-DNA glycosylase H2TH domain [Lyophyllum shimeji]|uniref:Formamidopyrimidine-DNA glycosylase H2TH domain n=1 Tax=Lyophyllum shimeji TaxID=47721 RepID=A0A9P3PJH6_LYOSH|nr:putative formamidopyrimidine-DNA glycosylase H2TH domain [Lyophyllum shimeji]